MPQGQVSRVVPRGQVSGIGLPDAAALSPGTLAPLSSGLLTLLRLLFDFFTLLRSLFSPLLRLRHCLLLPFILLILGLSGAGIGEFC